jgi:hypothetical protein
MISSPSWNRPSHYDRSMLRFDIQYAYVLVLPPFSELSDDSERVKRAMTRPSGTFNVILTPDSFARLPVYRGIAERCGGWSRGSLLVTTGSEGPDLIILDEVSRQPLLWRTIKDGVTSSLRHRPGPSSPLSTRHYKLRAWGHGHYPIALAALCVTQCDAVDNKCDLA